MGGGSNSIGMFIPFLDDPVDITGVEPLGRGETLGDHAASMKFGEKGIMHGFESIMLKDEKGEPAPVYSIASGLDYPSVGPEHAFLHDLGRVKYDTVSDEEAMEAFSNFPDMRESYRQWKAPTRWHMPCAGQRRCGRDPFWCA